MKRLAAVLVLAVACSQEPSTVATGTLDTRETKEVLYVIAPGGAQVYAKADTASEVMAEYLTGEALSVLAKQGEWSEVRQGAGSGWIRSAALGTRQQQENVPKFKVEPKAVPPRGVTGEIYIEATVNTEGDIVDLRLIANTTGSAELAREEMAALRAAKFHPFVLNGRQQTFTFSHRVTYVRE